MSGRNPSGLHTSSTSRAFAQSTTGMPQTPRAQAPPRYAYVPTPQSQKRQRDDASNDGAIYESSIAPEVAGVYGPLLRVRHKREIENSSIVPLPPRVIGGLRDQVERIKICNCRKSNCLKLYCDCFAGGIHCNAYCNCSACQNDGAVQNQPIRNKAILTTLEKNPDAFRSREAKSISGDGDQNSSEVASVASLGPKNVGCNCRKSRCLKKYCECYNRSAVCSSSCRCHDCQNFKGNPEREMKIKNEALNAEKQQRTEKAKHDYIVSLQKQQLEGKDNRDAVGKPAAIPPRAPMGVVGGTIDTNGGSLKRPPSGNSEMNTVGGEPWSLASSCTIPMKLINDEPCAALAFCRAGTATGKDGDNGVRGANYHEGNAVDVTMKDLARRSKSQANKQAQLEQKWSFETEDVIGTFEAMKHELLERKRDAGLIDGDIALSLSREYSYYDLVGSSLLASVELDLVDVKEAMKEAEKRARTMLAVERREEWSRVDTHASGIGDNGEAERRPAKTSKIGDPERDSATIHAAQDAALMRELARIIRKRALEMSEARMSKNSLLS